MMKVRGTCLLAPAAIAAALIASNALVQAATAQRQKPAPVASAGAREPDVAYGAYQRGLYITAFNEAKKRVDEKGDPKAMTLLGELYSDGLGVGRDDNQAAEWYKRASERGDREAMFALAVFRMTGRAGPRQQRRAAKLFEAAAKLGHAVAACNLGLLYLEGQLFPQDFVRAAQLFRTAADAGNPEAQYALATLYMEGRGVPKDQREATRLLGWAAIAQHGDAEVEYAIAIQRYRHRKEQAAAGPFCAGRRWPAVRLRKAAWGSCMRRVVVFPPTRYRRRSGTSSRRRAVPVTRSWRTSWAR